MITPVIKKHTYLSSRLLVGYFFVCFLLPATFSNTVAQSNRDVDDRYVSKRINHETGDTMKLFARSGKYTITSNKGVVLTEGIFDTSDYRICRYGNSVYHGEWIERYKNGNLKTKGAYLCDNPSGVWKYYFENGNVHKTETHNSLYLTLINLEKTDVLIFTKPNLRDGLFEEFHENGKPKTIGYYELVEIYADHDTLWTMDEITYEEIPNFISGDFWFPYSRKSGLWMHFDANGELIKIEDYTIKSKPDIITRPLTDRYQEIYKNWINASINEDD